MEEEEEGHGADAGPAAFNTLHDRADSRKPLRRCRALPTPHQRGGKKRGQEEKGDGHLDDEGHGREHEAVIEAVGPLGAARQVRERDGAQRAQERALGRRLSACAVQGAQGTAEEEQVEGGREGKKD